MPATKRPASRAQTVDSPGERIRRRRNELGLSQPALGAMLRTRTGKAQTGSKISQWERNQNLPEPAKRIELADALQTTTGDLFGEPEDSRLVSRLDLVEKRVDAVIRLQGLGDAVEGMVRASRQADRRAAKKAAEGLRTLRKERAPQGKRRATRKKTAGG